MIAGPPLAATPGTHPAYRSWLTGESGSVPATSELAAVATSSTAGPAPWFVSAESTDWALDMAADLDPVHGDRLDRNLDLLRQGRAGVVVTGQQPGFLGGPLLTIHKIATAVALAERLTAAGEPTIPVFWSGDADDDLLEALLPVAWIPGSGRLVRSDGLALARGGRQPRRRLGTLPASRWHGTAAAWFGNVPAARDDLDLAACWSGRAPGTWAERQRRALLQVFGGSGLLVVSGDDPRLHRAGAPFYAALDGRLDELADLARRRGGELAREGAAPPIGERSLARPLYRVEGDQRIALEGAPPADPGDLRPGVMLRSPLQDWLLAPRAVVVGPGELAYLRQLEPVHAALGIRRSPLVPRLACWLRPADLDPGLLAAHRAAAAGEPAGASARVEAWLEDMSGELAGLLGEVGGVAPERARDLADRRAGRWAKGVRSLLRGERALARAAGPREPAWVFPDGMRQERALAWGAILGQGGHAVRDLILAAARRHLDAGAEGNWCEWECDWDEPTS